MNLYRRLSSRRARRLESRRYGAGSWEAVVPSFVTRLGLSLWVTLLAGCSLAPATQSHKELSSELFARAEVWGTRGAGAGQFNKPRSVTVDRADNVYVVDMTGRVQKFSPQGEWLRAWQMPETELGKAKGMCLDQHGRVVVIEPHYSRVNHFSTDGRLECQWGQHGTNAGQLAFPRAVAMNSRAELWISEYGVVERVQRFAPDGGSLLAGFGHYGSKPGEFNRPEGVTVGPQNRLYVADSCNHRVQVFADDGHWLASLGEAGAGVGALSYPYDVVVDRAGNLFVCEFGNSRIQVFDALHRPREIIGRAGGAPGEFNNPWGIALDSQGNLYVADAGNHRVQKLIRRPPDA
jgi:DNA-binding beta-propeller fold protein YncE